VRAIQTTATPAAPQTLVCLDPWAGSTCGVQVVVSGGATFTIDYSFDDPNALISPIPKASMAFSSTMCPAGAIGGAASLTFALPVSPLWMRLTLLNATGSVRATYLQPQIDTSTAIAAAGPAPPFAFPGDPLGLYSLRQLGAYSGPCLQAFRTSDSATLDIGFAAGTVDMAAALAFAAPGQLRVSKLYDQSGHGNDLVQSSHICQLNLINGAPWLCFMNIDGNNTGALRTAAALNLTGDQTMGFVGQMMTDYAVMPLSQFDSSNGWFQTFNGAGSSAAPGSLPGVFQYFSTGNGVAIPDAGRYFAQTKRYATTRASNVATLYVNGAQTATGASTNNAASTAPFTVGGQDMNSFAFVGLMGEIFVYASALSGADRATIDASEAAAFADTGFSTPYSGTHGLEFDFAEFGDAGDVLAFERTDSWTVFAASQLFYLPVLATTFYTNVPGSGTTFPGHEIWIDEVGRLRVRLISDFAGLNYLGVIGTTNVVDGKKHAIAYSYDGSSTAAGVKVYIDGALETTTLERDTLTGSIIGAGQSFTLASQQAVHSFNLTGTLAFFQVDKIVRNQAYIQANFVGGAIPPNDVANTKMRLLLNEGSGATANDTSGQGNNVTLTSAGMWFP
jgi:hypothetical protein